MNKVSPIRIPRFPSNPEAKKNRHDHLIIPGLAVVGAGALATALAMGAVESVVEKFSPAVQTGSSDPSRYGEPNPDILSVEIADGARIRYEPKVIDENDGTTNRVTEEVEHGFSFPAAGDVYVHIDDNDDRWYGMPADSLTEVAEDIDASKDPDGIVWVSEQRASATSRND